MSPRANPEAAAFRVYRYPVRDPADVVLYMGMDPHTDCSVLSILNTTLWAACRREMACGASGGGDTGDERGRHYAHWATPIAPAVSPSAAQVLPPATSPARSTASTPAAYRARCSGSSATSMQQTPPLPPSPRLPTNSHGIQQKSQDDLSMVEVKIQKLMPKVRFILGNNFFVLSIYCS